MSGKIQNYKYIKLNFPTQLLDFQESVLIYQIFIHTLDLFYKWRNL